MGENTTNLNDIRLNLHRADAELRFHLHLKGNVLSKKFGYGNLKGLDAVARYLQERDGIPMHDSLASSTDLLSSQLEGVLTKNDYDPNTAPEPSKVDLATRDLMISEARLAALLEQFGDELGDREGLDVEGLDAVRLYLAREYGFNLHKLEALQPIELRKYLAKELKGWTVKENR